MDGNCNYYGTWDYTQHAVCNAGLAVQGKLVEQMKQGGCLKCHAGTIGSDWINLKTPERSRILRAPMAKKGGGLGLAWCRDRKAPNPLFPLVTERHQPPDVFRPKRKPAPKKEGKPVITFSDTNSKVYKAMLSLICGAREQALKTPRVDMPGAKITRGKCRELVPLGPPKYAGK